MTHFAQTAAAVGGFGAVKGALKGATGHSQGVASAVAVAISGTMAEYVANATKMVRYLFWQGTQCQALVSGFVLTSSEPEEAPMLAVSGLSADKLVSLVEQTNEKMKLPPNKALAVALINGPEACVVSGEPKVLAGFKKAVEAQGAEAGDQARVPFSQRKPAITTAFLRTTAPFHSGAMAAGAAAAICADAARLGLAIPGSALTIPVYSTADGSDLRALADGDVMPAVIAMQAVDRMDYRAALGAVSAAAGVTHVLDFGPGGADGVGGAALFCARLTAGRGVQVIVARAAARKLARADTPTLSGSAALLSGDEGDVPFAVDWAVEFGPKLVRRACDGKVIVNTRFTEALGKPPVLMSGMTPTTSLLGVDLVAACANGGYHAEFAGGGLPTAEINYEKFDELVAKQDAGVGITLNLLYLNARLWALQFSIVQELRRKGVPIESITVAAGVPTPEKAAEIMEICGNLGIKVVGFKPGSADHIAQVVEIARQHPAMTVMLQWTGGRGGGHHSFEDMHAPLLQTYAAIRAVPNIVLVCGSGFGDAAGSLPYLTGAWSEAYGRPKMPMDCILMGSRPMVAKEAATAEAVKQLICAQPGVDDELEWETSYSGVAGGILTVQSELGEPIHKIATRGMRCWRDFDAKYFKIPRAERPAAIAADKEEIIRRINADYQKPYFGRKADGTVCDLGEMTYAEVLQRMVSLLWIERPDGVVVHVSLAVRRWADVSHQTRTHKLMARFEQRFNRGGKPVASISALDDSPMLAVDVFLAAYPAMAAVLLSDDDVEFFLDLCRSTRNGKPVTFIPVIDEQLDVWFKKDSLWYSEQIDAVPDCDVDRVCILQGPVAVKYSTVANEPICDIMSDVHDGHVRMLMEEENAKSDAQFKIPEVDFVGDLLPWRSDLVRARAADLSSYGATAVEAAGGGQLVTVTMPAADDEDEIPEAAQWIDQMASIHSGWLCAALRASHVVKGKLWHANPMPQLLRPRCGQRVEILLDAAGVPVSVTAYDALDLATPAVVLANEGGTLRLSVMERRPATTEMAEEMVPFTVLYAYKPDMGYSPIHELMEGADTRMTDFYAKIWLDGPSGDFGVDTVHTGSTVVSAKDIADFNLAIGRAVSPTASVDFTTVASWQPLIKSLFAREIQGNLLRLVHLSHKYKMLGTGAARQTLAEGERIDSVVEVASVLIVPGGKEITAVGTLQRSGEPFVEITSKFFIRGDFTDYAGTFKKTSAEVKVTLKDAVDAAVLMSRPWYVPSNGEVSAGMTLTLQLHTHEQYASATTMRAVNVEGSVFSSTGASMGTVMFAGADATDNPVTRFVEAHKNSTIEASILESGGYTMLATPHVTNAPADPKVYAVASRDLNPIHRNYYLADMAELPKGSVINHGMWACALARRVVEEGACDGDPTRLASFEAQFLGMVFPGDELVTQLSHTGMLRGKKVVQVTMLNGSGERVLSGRAEVDEVKTAYVFTGQGSAEPGMGMDRYAASAAVKDIWDRADRHLSETYGFSILDIVRRNPQRHTVFFGGKKGAQIRRNYMKLTVASPDGTGMVPLLPAITATSRSYTFETEAGLLFATQFTQPALVLLEKSQFTELYMEGYVPEDSMFAGHSLGEYAGLSSIASVLSVPNLVETVFLRGLVMQNAVTRDAKGRSEFQMMAVNPTRIGRWFKTNNLVQLVDMIDKASGRLLQIVNFNVQDYQYVVAGELRNLESLTNICNILQTDPKVLKKISIEDLVDSALAKADAKLDGLRSSGDVLKLARGKATIPLPGIGQGLSSPNRRVHLL
jgi:fatty acid synthase subunit beta